MNKSLYIHIPFCQQKCIYCDFYSKKYDQAIASAYIDTLCKQLSGLDNCFSTIYIGGGTPTVLTLELLNKLLTSLKFISKGCEEFTIEANPESLNREKLILFLDKGINRISIGMQSLFEDKLVKLSRIHSAQTAYEKVYLAKQSGFKNISIDLIFGLWQERLVNWHKEIIKATQLPVKHISCYMLTYEKNTRLYSDYKDNKIKPLSDKLNSEMYLLAMKILPKYGFNHYEVSNFAKPGFSCKHNINYWQNGQYLGLGAGAFSYIKGVREKNIANISGYIKRFEKGRSMVIFKEKLTPLKTALETGALGIRIAQGIDYNIFLNKTGFDISQLRKDAIVKLYKSGFIKYIKGKNKIIGIKLTTKGFLFSDTVSSGLL